jgi:hypothetical protein
MGRAITLRFLSAYLACYETDLVPLEYSYFNLLFDIQRTGYVLLYATVL